MVPIWLLDKQPAGNDILTYTALASRSRMMSAAWIARYTGLELAAVASCLSNLRGLGAVQVDSSGTETVYGVVFGAVTQPKTRPVHATVLPDMPDAVVYYLQRATDGAIKIGTSTNLTSRLSRLREKHGTLTVLATEPGSYALEVSRHEQFASLGLGGEWFRPCVELLEHIEAVKA